MFRHLVTEKLVSDSRDLLLTDAGCAGVAVDSGEKTGLTRLYIHIIKSATPQIYQCPRPYKLGCKSRSQSSTTTFGEAEGRVEKSNSRKKYKLIDNTAGTKHGETT